VSPAIVKSSPKKEEDNMAEGVGKVGVRGKCKNTSADGHGGEVKKKAVSKVCLVFILLRLWALPLAGAQRGI
jgi:hypothetical protein